MYICLLSATWFEVHLTGSGDLHEDAQALRDALWKHGHGTWLICDDLGHWSLAAAVKGPAPQRQLESLLRQAGLSGSFVPLRRPVAERHKVGPRHDWPRKSPK
jgi:hypothetical protein